MMGRPPNIPKIKSPKHTFLPFFAYGVFKPNQPAFSRIKKYIQEPPIKVYVNYELRERNGMPILTTNKNEKLTTVGYLIQFSTTGEEKAYNIISKTKSSKLYEWTTLRINNENTNVLIGKEQDKSNIFPDNNGDYDASKDPIFYKALNFIREELYSIRDDFFHVEEYFKLQMCYMLLWASIERFTTMKYGNNTKRYNNKKFSTEPIFKERIKNIDLKENIVLNSEDLKEYKFNPQKPKDCINYYYAIRCNVIHSGKSSFKDYNLLLNATKELLIIFKDVLDYNFRNNTEFL